MKLTLKDGELLKVRSNALILGIFEEGLDGIGKQIDRKVRGTISKVLDPGEFKSTWLGNKAVYRTRMAMADDGELIILAPGVKEFGEDVEIDRLIRKYGYLGTPRTLDDTKNNDDLGANLSAAASLIESASRSLGLFLRAFSTSNAALSASPLANAWRANSTMFIVPMSRACRASAKLSVLTRGMLLPPSISANSTSFAR